MIMGHLTTDEQKRGCRSIKIYYAKANELRSLGAVFKSWRADRRAKKLVGDRLFQTPGQLAVYTLAIEVPLEALGGDLARPDPTLVARVPVFRGLPKSSNLTALRQSEIQITRRRLSARRAFTFNCARKRFDQLHQPIQDIDPHLLVDHGGPTGHLPTPLPATRLDL